MAEQFGRIVEVRVNKRIFRGDEYDIEFDIPFDDSPEDNASKISIYNLADTTIRAFGKDPYVIVNAGYTGDVGAVLLGIGTAVNTDRGDVDKKTTIEALDGSKGYYSQPIKKTYAKGTTAKQIFEDLSRLTGVKIGRLALPANRVYRTGKTVKGSLSAIFAGLAADCRTKAFAQNGRVYIGPRGKGLTAVTVLDSAHGLIGSPTPIEKEVDTGNEKNPKKKLQGYKVRCLLNHRIFTDALLEIRSQTANGRFWVDSGRHFSNDSDFMTEVEVYPT